jgi:hypothetical protein
MRNVGVAGSIATGIVAGINAICTGGTICADGSPIPEMGALRSQQGATGAEAGA